MGERREAKGTLTAQQSSDSLGNEADRNARRRQRGRGAHNEHMQRDVRIYGEATRKCTSIYSTSRTVFCREALSTAKANKRILLTFTRSLTSQ